MAALLCAWRKRSRITFGTGSLVYRSWAWPKSVHAFWKIGPAFLNPAAKPLGLSCTLRSKFIALSKWAHSRDAGVSAG